MIRLLGIFALLVLSACSSTTRSRNVTAEAINNELNAVVQERANAKKSNAVNDALLPPVTAGMQVGDGKPQETRFDLVVNNTPANQVFTAIASGTRYSILVPADVAGNISLNLKDVTVFEALETIRNVYGYEYKVDGTRIFIQGITMQTRIFQVSYLTGQRDGTSSLSVTSSSISSSSGTSSAASTSTTTPTAAKQNDSTHVSMTTSANFWDDLSKALLAIVGNENGRSVVISPLSGVIVVRAMPEELRSVAAYLKASQISVERQVILEAKIIEVSLIDSLQTGVNWGSFTNDSNNFASVGQIGAGGSLVPTIGGVPSPISIAPGTGSSLTSLTGTSLSGIPGSSLSAGESNTGSLFGLAFQTGNFAALLNFLESQGSVHVLSSPRIATLNNQKAVLKVGTDEFFVTGITTTATVVGTTAVITPSVTLQPFFSGIALDVTPRIDENNEIILHVHPSVGQVSTVNKILNLGTALGTYTLPLASSAVSETDSIIRARDGQIVAIGGLMRQATIEEESGFPGLSKLIFGHTAKRTEKRELVILIKPTVVNGDKDWSDDITRSRDRVNGMSR
jgi:MSHA biogenesis protein MshL